MPSVAPSRSLSRSRLAALRAKEGETYRMNSSPQGVRERIEALEPGDRETKLIAIDGHGGAGKSYLAAWLSSRLGAQVIHIDDFGRPGRPYDAWDWDRFRAQVLDPLLSDAPARYQRYDWDEDRLTDWVGVAVGGVVIAEGVSVTRTELGDPWDLKVWVEAPYELRLARGVERDGEAMRDVWVDHWMPQEDRYEKAQRPRDRADVVVLGYVGE